jgi:hypothetical protein
LEIGLADINCEESSDVVILKSEWVLNSMTVSIREIEGEADTQRAQEKDM